MIWLLIFLLGFSIIYKVIENKNMRLNKIGFGSSRGYNYKISNDDIIREKNIRLFYENGDKVVEVHLF